MKKSLLTRKASSRPPYWFKRTLILILAVLLALAMWFILPTVVRSVVAVVVSPVTATRVWLSQSSDSFPQFWRDRAALVAEITELEKQVAMNTGSDSTITKLIAENNQFRQLCEAVPEERVIARVVGRPPQLPYDVLMLDRGLVHGVVERAPVFVGRDQVIGYVSRVYDKTALVTLITTADFRSMAYIIGPNIYTFAEGVGGGMIRVVVPQGIPLTIGDTVILPAIDSGVYGRIAEIVTSPTQPEQFGFVPLPFSLQSMEYVSIGREPIAPNTYEEAETLVAELKTELFTVDLPPGVLVTPDTATTSTTTSTTTSATSSVVE